MTISFDLVLFYQETEEDGFYEWYQMVEQQLFQVWGAHGNARCSSVRNDPCDLCKSISGHNSYYVRDLTNWINMAGIT